MTNNETDAAKAGRTQGRRRNWLLALATVTVLGGGAFAVGAMAQSADSGPRWQREGMGRGDYRGEMYHGRGMGGMRGERFARFCAMDTARWQPVARLYVKTDLRLNAEQASAFDALADTLLPALEDTKREACNNFSNQGATAPDKVKQLADVLRKAADAAEKAVEPSRRFYASLDEGQKARVDAVMERSQRRWRP
jgi:hypothetical protein